MSISVVIPAYNCADWIAETIQSVLHQTCAPSEILVVDDASTDRTPEIVTNLAKSSSIPIRLCRRSHGSGGPARPLNEGLRNANSKYIALLDHDDLMRPEKLAYQLAAMEAHPEASLSFADYVVFDEAGERPGMPEALRSELVQRSIHGAGCYIVPPDVGLQLQVIDPGLIQSCSNLMFRREAWFTVGPFDEARSVLCDYPFKLRLARHAPMLYVPRVLFRKRCHAQNLFSLSASLRLTRTIYSLGFAAVREESRAALRDPGFQSRFTEHFVKAAWLARQRRQHYHSAWIAWNLLALVGPRKAVLSQAIKSAARLVLG